MLAAKMWTNSHEHSDIKYSAHFFTLKNDAEIFPVNYTWKVTEKGYNVMAFMMQWIILVKLCVKNKVCCFAKNHCEIQVHTILVCALYLIKCCILDSMSSPIVFIDFKFLNFLSSGIVWRSFAEKYRPQFWTRCQCHKNFFLPSSLPPQQNKLGCLTQRYRN